MTSQVPVATEHQTIGQIHDELKRGSKDFKTINYIYILDADKKLVGTLSIKDIFSHPSDVKAGDACKRSPIVFVHPEAHQERAAYLALQHNIKAIPVVDKNKVFLGEITADSILSILHKEMHEDTLRRAGIRHPAAHAGTLTTPFLSSLRHRLPWLLVGLAGGVLAARIIGLFESTLSENLVLAAFIPLIVYMSDAVRTQMEAYIIRDLAFDAGLPFLRYFCRQLLVVTGLGALLSLVLGVSYAAIGGDKPIAVVLSVSLLFAVISSVSTGVVVPYVFSRMKLDPADASGPVATILQDMLSIVIYFGIATLLL